MGVRGPNTIIGPLSIADRYDVTRVRYRFRFVPDGTRARVVSLKKRPADARINAARRLNINERESWSAGRYANYGVNVILRYRFFFFVFR